MVLLVPCLNHKTAETFEAVKDSLENGEVVSLDELIRRTASLMGAEPPSASSSASSGERKRSRGVMEPSLDLGIALTGGYFVELALSPVEF
jgi:hypothetical protein